MNETLSLLLENFIFLFPVINYNATNIFASKYMGMYSDYYLGVDSQKENEQLKKGLYKWSTCSLRLLNYFQYSADLRSWVFLYSFINLNGTSLEVEMMTILPSGIYE